MTSRQTARSAGSGMEKSGGPAELNEKNNTTEDPSENNLTFYPELAGAMDIRDLKERIHGIVKRLGFSDFAFVHGKCHGNELPMVTNPHAHIEAYENAGCHEYDLLEQYREKNVKPAFFSWLYQPVMDPPYETEIFRTNRQIVEISESFGYFDHYYVCMKSAHPDDNVLLVVTHKGMDPGGFRASVVPHETTLKLLCQAIDYIVVTKFSEYFLGPEEDLSISLNPKPLRVLAALANKDMTITQLSDELCVSSVTVHHHITTARRALRARTNIGAIKKAIKLGLINFD